MHMRGNRPWGSALALHLCKAFPKEPISKCWGNLWISTISHGFSIWPITPPTPPHLSFVAPFVGSSYGNARGGDVTTRQIHPWQLWD